MYNAILDFFPKHYTKLREITTGAGQGYVSIHCCSLFMAQIWWW